VADPTPTLVVGFDLDMTLVDARPGVIATCEAVTRETGVAIDGPLAASRLGPPLEVELANWVEADRVDELAEIYRRHYPEFGVPGSTAMPGAHEALAAIRAIGGSSVIVSAKSSRGVADTVAHLGLDVDATLGGRFAEAKGAALATYGADVYVGDHAADMIAARSCDAVAVGVCTGMTSAAELRAAGADVVLVDLTEFPEWLASHMLSIRLAALDDRLRELESVVVAFSGGADSAFLLAAAVRSLGVDNVIAATAVSPSLPAAELAGAAAFAAGLGVRHVTPATDELSRAGYRDNAGDRCFFCKAELLDVLAPLAADLGMRYVATGTNADDAKAGFRPGIRAAAERGAVTPLLDAGLTKSDVRQASRRWGLATWDKPAAACLSSRIAYGVAVTAQRLSRVERAETALRVALANAGLAVRHLRVRDLGDRARVELDAGLVDAVKARPDLLEVIAGFDAVELDPRGFRSGAMNELLVDAERWR